MTYWAASQWRKGQACGGNLKHYKFLCTWKNQQWEKIDCLLLNQNNSLTCFCFIHYVDRYSAVTIKVQGLLTSYCHCRLKLIWRAERYFNFWRDANIQSKRSNETVIASSKNFKKTTTILQMLSVELFWKLAYESNRSESCKAAKTLGIQQIFADCQILYCAANHWCRRRGCRGCNHSPTTFDLVKIRATSLEIWAECMKTFAK